MRWRCSYFAGPWASGSSRERGAAQLVKQPWDGERARAGQKERRRRASQGGKKTADCSGGLQTSKLLLIVDPSPLPGGSPSLTDPQTLVPPCLQLAARLPSKPRLPASSCLRSTASDPISASHLTAQHGTAPIAHCVSEPLQHGEFPKARASRAAESRARKVAGGFVRLHATPRDWDPDTCATLPPPDTAIKRKKNYPRSCYFRPRRRSVRHPASHA